MYEGYEWHTACHMTILYYNDVPLSSNTLQDAYLILLGWYAFSIVLPFQNESVQTTLHRALYMQLVCYVMLCKKLEIFKNIYK